MLRRSIREGVWLSGENDARHSFVNDVEELVEDVICSINGIRISTGKAARLHTGNLDLALFFALVIALFMRHQIRPSHGPTVE